MPLAHAGTLLACLVADMDRRDFLVFSRRVALGLIVGAVVAPVARLASDAARGDSVDIVSMWVGGVTSDVARAVVSLSGPSSDVRLVVSRHRDLRDAVVGPASGTDAHVARVGVSGLLAATRYYWAPRVDGAIDADTLGTFTTAPAGAASFTFAFASCAESGSNHRIFDAVRSLAPDLFIHMGDLHYLDIGRRPPRDGRSYVPEFRAAYHQVLASDRQHRLYREVPTAYMWDDHDYGPNDSDRTNPARGAALQVYRERVPHYPLPSRSSICQSFVWGRVRFILTDLRSRRSRADVRDGPDKVKMGAEQEAWFGAEFVAAKAAGQFVCWLSSTPWVAGEPESGDDDWGAYATERTRVATLIRDAGMAERTFVIAGDMHALAVYDHTVDDHGDYAAGGGANMSVFHAAALDEYSSHKGGPYTLGPYPEREGVSVRQFATLQVQDDGGTGLRLTFTGYAWNGDDAVPVMRRSIALGERTAATISS
jgi:phosphodiesterase/alkaline phosphatase D-like protein